MAVQEGIPVWTVSGTQEPHSASQGPVPARPRGDGEVPVRGDDQQGEGVGVQQGRERGLLQRELRACEREHRAKR